MPPTLCNQRGISLSSSESTPHKIFNQGARILNGEKCINVRCMVGLSGQGTIGNGVENLCREHLHKEKNGVGLQIEAR